MNGCGPAEPSNVKKVNNGHTSHDSMLPARQVGGSRNPTDKRSEVVLTNTEVQEEHTNCMAAQLKQRKELGILQIPDSAHPRALGPPEALVTRNPSWGTRRRITT